MSDTWEKRADRALHNIERSGDSLTGASLADLVGHTVLREWCDWLLLDDGTVLCVEGYGLIGEAGGGFQVYAHPGTRDTRDLAKERSGWASELTRPLHGPPDQ
jgi:hypothetical protein